MQQLRKRRNVHLRLVYHNAQLEAELRQQAQDLGIAEHVEFVGILGPSELAEEYHQADLLVLPSFADCLPSVVTEAFLCGTPVVAGGGVRRAGTDRALRPGRSAGRFRRSGERHGDDACRSAALAGHGRRDACVCGATFKPETMVARHLALYQRHDRQAAPCRPGAGPTGWIRWCAWRSRCTGPSPGARRRDGTLPVRHTKAKSMNISHISVSTLPVLYRFGGAIERRIVEIAREQARRGHRVSVYSVGDTTDTREVNGVTYHFLKCRTRLPLKHLEFQYQSRARGEEAL